MMFLCQARKVGGHVFVSEVSILHLSTIFLLNFENVLTMRYFLFSFDILPEMSFYVKHNFIFV